MKNKAWFVQIAVCFLLSSCATVDVQNEKLKLIQERNNAMETSTVTQAPVIEYYNTEKTISTVAVEPVIVTVQQPIVISREEYVNNATKGTDAIKESMNDAMVTPQNFIGGTQLFDYDENKQFPVFVKVLGQTVIQLEPGEEALGMPFLSDTMRWEVTGNVWSKNGIDTQLVLIKPFEVGLSTNMLIVTNKRLYNLILTSTKDTYMPMIKFRYPQSPVFITSQTKREQVEKEYASGTVNKKYLSFNYIIRKGWFGLFDISWTPKEVYDDGAKTYIVMPEMILQKEFPTIFEKNSNIVNYRVNKNIIIIDKILEKATMKIGRMYVVVTKKKGEAKDLSKMERLPIEPYSEDVPLSVAPSSAKTTTSLVQKTTETKTAEKETYKIKYDTTEAPLWKPLKVYDDGKKTYIVFPSGTIEILNPVIIDEENKPVEFIKNGTMVEIAEITTLLKVAFNGSVIFIEHGSKDEVEKSTSAIGE